MLSRITGRVGLRITGFTAAAGAGVTGLTVVSSLAGASPAFGASAGLVVTGETGGVAGLAEATGTTGFAAGRIKILGRVGPSGCLATGGTAGLAG